MAKDNQTRDIGEAPARDVIESLTRIVINSLTVRVWREEAEVADGYNVDDIREALWQLPVATVKTVVDAVKKLPRINAIEVLNQEKQGVVYYKNWP